MSCVCPAGPAVARPVLPAPEGVLPGALVAAAASALSAAALPAAGRGGGPRLHPGQQLRQLLHAHAPLRRPPTHLGRCRPVGDLLFPPPAVPGLLRRSPAGGTGDGGTEATELPRRRDCGRRNLGQPSFLYSVVFVYLYTVRSSGDMHKILYAHCVKAQDVPFYI